MTPGEQRRRRLVRTLLVLEHVLLLTAGLAFGWYAGVQIAAAKEQASWARELEQHAVTAAQPASRHASSQASFVRAPAPARHALIGRVELPRVGLSAIAREGVDARTLRSAVGHVPETALPGEPGNVAFAAHRDTYFRELKHVRKGDQVVVTTPDGRYEYVVRETRIVPPSDMSVLGHTEERTLTLITCYPFDYIGSAPSRFIVRAAKKE